MIEINVVYEGSLHCIATHAPSGMSMTTDAPKDNMGKGESFSPTDLVATALATCMVTTMGILALRMGWDMTGTTARVTKEMVATPLRRIGRLAVEIRVRGNFDAEQRQKLENAAHCCPVSKSLHPDIQIPVEIHWETPAAR